MELNPSMNIIADYGAKICQCTSTIFYRHLFGRINRVAEVRFPVALKYDVFPGLRFNWFVSGAVILAW